MVDLEREHAAPGEPGEMNGAAARVGDDRSDPLGVVADAGTGRGRGGGAAAGLVPGEHGELIAKRLDLGRPHPAVGNRAMQKEDWLAPAIPPVGDLKARCAGDLHCSTVAGNGGNAKPVERFIAAPQGNPVVHEGGFEMSETRLNEPVEPEEARQMLGRREAAAIDLRDDEEAAQGHAPGAVVVQGGDLEAAAERARAGKEIPILVFCAKGNRSKDAAKELSDAGIEAASVKGGWEAWAAADKPVQPGRDTEYDGPDLSKPPGT